MPHKGESTSALAQVRSAQSKPAYFGIPLHVPLCRKLRKAIGNAETERLADNTAAVAIGRASKRRSAGEAATTQINTSGILVCLLPVTNAAASMESHKSATFLFSRARNARSTDANA